MGQSLNTNLGSFELVRELGSGGFGTVWLARSPFSSEDVALKILKTEGVQTQGQFKEEFSLLTALHHPHLAQVYDFGKAQEGERNFFTSEYCSGHEIAQATEGRDADYVEEAFVQILMALDYIHAAGVIHFDIKPTNILLHDVGGHPRVKLVDFGLAVRWTGQIRGQWGTLATMAPEILTQSQFVDHRADLYSLGMVLLHCLTRQWPFDIKDPNQVVEWQLRQSLPENFWNDFPKIPKYMQEIIEKTIQKNPAKRFSSARAVLNFINLATNNKYSEIEQKLHLTIPSNGPLVERDTILNNIQEQFKAIFMKSENNRISPVVSIVGERGVGKTRLLDEMRHFIQLHDVTLISITCQWQSQIWNELQKIVDTTLEFQSTLTSESSAAMALWPIRQMAHDLIDKAKQKPLCLFFDDYHQADDETLQLVSALKNRIQFSRKQGEPIPLMIVVANESQSQNQSQNQSKDEDDKTVHKVSKLSQAAILQYLQLVIGNGSSLKNLAQLLYDYSGGLPLLMVEGLRYIRSHIADGEIPKELPPPQVSLLYDEVLQKLAPNERLALMVLSILKRPIDEAELAQVTHSTSIELNNIMRRMIEWDLVKKNYQPIIYQISSQGLGMSLVETLPEEEKRTLHYKIAEGLEQVEGASFEEKALHWEGARQKQKALNYYHMAGDSLQSIGKLASAAHCLMKALPLCQKGSLEWEKLILDITSLLIYAGRYQEAEDYLGVMAHHPPTVRQQEVAGWLDFKRRRFSEAKQHYERALKILHGEEKKKHVELKNALANIALQTGDAEQAVRLFEESLQGERQLPPEDIVKITNNHLGLALSLVGETERALDFFQDKLRLFESQELHVHVIPIYNSMGYVYLKASRYREAHAVLAKALELAERTGNLHAIFSILGNLITTLTKEGQYAECLNILKKMLQYQERLGTLRDLSYNLLRQGSVYLNLGIEEIARVNFDRGRQLAEEISDQGLMAWFNMMEGYLEMELGSIELSQENFEKSLELSEIKKDTELISWIHYAMAQLKYEQEEYDLAGDYLCKIGEITADAELTSRIDLLQLKTNIKLKKNLEDISQSFIGLEQKCQQFNLLEILWQVYQAWGDHENSYGHQQKAHTFYQQGVRIVESIATSLPEEYQDRYRQQKFRKQLLQHSYHKAQPKMSFSYGAIQRRRGTMIDDKTVSILLDINKKMVTEHDPHKLLEFIMDIAVEISGAEEGLLLLLNEQSEFEVKIARNINKEDLEVTRFSQTIAREVMQTGNPIFSLNIPEDRKLSALESVSVLGLKTVACVPLRLQNKTLGVIYLDTQQRTSSLAKDSLTLLEAFADQAALSLKNALDFQDKEKSHSRLEEDLNDTKKILEEKEVHLHELEALVSKGPRRTLYPYEQIIGRSKKMEEVLKTMDKITDAQVPVLIFGETGTGKELIAHALHENSLRKNKNFVAVNCSAFTETVLESELFGYHKGAFTGADRDRRGLFEVADGGTLFLDEVADMSLSMQAKVLRAIQEQEVLRVGGRIPIKISVRLVSASNKDLKDLVRRQKFREDLYFRIAGMALNIPPLRERKEDISLLVKHVLTKVKEENSFPKELTIDSNALRRLMTYHWPGNIRELEQCLTNAAFLAGKGDIQSKHLVLQDELYPERTGQGTGESESDHTFPFHPDRTLDDYEKEIILKMLKYCEGNKSKAARRLGVSRLTLHNKIKSYEN
jgi:Nif-specific regulatory protein